MKGESHMIYETFVVKESERSYIVTEICSGHSITVPKTDVEELYIKGESNEMLALVLALLSKLRFDIADDENGEKVNPGKSISAEPNFKEELKRVLEKSTIEFLINELSGMKYYDVWAMFYRK